MEKVYFFNSRGEKLTGLLFLGNGQYSLIICHGFRGSKEGGGRAINLAKKAQHLGFTTLCFDFSGTGESQGEFASITLGKQVDDLKSAVDFLFGRTLQPIILLGRSFGGTTAIIQASQDNRIKGLLTWAAPCLLEETFRKILLDKYQLLLQGCWVEIDDGYSTFSLKPNLVKEFSQYNILQQAAKIAPRPFLILHGEADETVDVRQASLLYQAAEEPKEVYLLEGANHQFLNHQEEIQGISLNWLQKYFSS